MKKVKITLRGGGVLEWTPRNQTKNILGLWNWMSRTQLETAILNFTEGGVRISEIAAMEYIEEPEPVESTNTGKHFAEVVLKAGKATFGDDRQYRAIIGIVYALGKEPIVDINSFERIDVYPNLSSLLATAGTQELTANKTVFAEILCRVPLDEFERFNRGNWVIVNRQDILSEEVKFEDTYEITPRYVQSSYYLTEKDREEPVTVFAEKPDADNEDSKYSEVYSLTPVTSSSTEKEVVPSRRTTYPAWEWSSR